MSAEHPTPWTFNAVNEFEDTPILDKNGHCVLVRDSGYYPPDLDTCREIVDAVNEHAKMHEVAANLLRSRDAAIEDGERMRSLVRRLAEQLQDAVRLTPYDAIARALLREAREAIGRARNEPTRH